jgi:hypothetical protein
MGRPIFGFGLAGFPFGEREEIALFISRWAGRRVEAGFVRNPGAHGLGHFVVDFEDDALGPVLAVVFLLVLAADNWEGVHDVRNSVPGGRKMSLELGQFLRRLVAHSSFIGASGLPLAVWRRRQIEVKKGSIQLAAKHEAAVLIPSKGRPVPPAVECEGLKVPCRVGQFEHTGEKPVAQSLSKGGPGTKAAMECRRKHRKLLLDEAKHVDTAELLPGDIVENKAADICVKAGGVDTRRGATGEEHREAAISGWETGSNPAPNVRAFVALVTLVTATYQRLW